MLPSLVATDLDGTFLSTTGQASERNVAAVLKAAELGIPIVVATGRPARWLQCLDPIRPAHPYVLASNGAVVFDLAEDRILERHTVPADVCRDVAQEMRAICPDIHFGVEYGIGWGREVAFPLRGDRVEADVVGGIDDMIARPFVKLLVASRVQSSDDLAEQLAPVCDGRLTCTWSIGGAIGLLEVSALGVTKAHTLRLLADELGADLTHAVAFGDMPNDLAMLHAVGHGHAMADAHPLLVAAGFRRAPGHDESGVGVVLEELLGLSG
ncbi:HAD family hydrolase [Luteococcus sp. Sow4_B9]|uniref:HAD family hydrolase n=1 Tax=Luteococcus sp. Sow4_B9 TaxID=3438792 RepID=UPI003F96EC04